jgi:protease stability complex PrcB-like protein
MNTVPWMLIVSVLLQGDVMLRTLDKGDQSNIDGTRQVVARTVPEWTTLWRQHSPDRPRPSVDFAREMVAGVFLGSRPSAGFAIDIVSARDDHGALIVRYRETTPPPGAIAAQVITSAYCIVALPRRDGDVRFERLQLVQ